VQDTLKITTVVHDTSIVTKIDTVKAPAKKPR